jgi:hypothetical protein
MGGQAATVVVAEGGVIAIQGGTVADAVAAMVAAVVRWQGPT